MQEKYLKNPNLLLVLFIVIGYLIANTVKYKLIWGNFEVGSCLSNKLLETWNSWDCFFLLACENSVAL